MLRIACRHTGIDLSFTVYDGSHGRPLMPIRWDCMILPEVRSGSRRLVHFYGRAAPFPSSRFGFLVPPGAQNLISSRLRLRHVTLRRSRTLFRLCLDDECKALQSQLVNLSTELEPPYRTFQQSFTSAISRGSHVLAEASLQSEWLPARPCPCVTAALWWRPA